MSRSHRKPWVTDYFKTKYQDKRLANKRVRRYNRFIPKGGYFKKLYDSYNICDFKWYEPESKELFRK